MRTGNRLLLIAALLVAAAAGFVLWRDLSLPERARKVEQTQVLVESLDLEREVSGDVFRIKAAEARKMQDGTVEASSLDVGAVMHQGSVWFLKAASGRLMPDGVILLSGGLYATNQRKAGDQNMEAESARWDPVSRSWELEGGITLRHGAMKAGGRTGLVEPDGRITLSGGAWATWIKP